MFDRVLNASLKVYLAKNVFPFSREGIGLVPTLFSFSNEILQKTFPALGNIFFHVFFLDQLEVVVLFLEFLEIL